MEMPKPPTSVSPQSRRNSSLAHAVGPKRNVVLGSDGRIVDRSDRILFFFVCFMTGLTYVVFDKALWTDSQTTRGAFVETTPTEIVLADFARHETLRTEVLAAFRTRRVAFRTNVISTPIAACTVVCAHACTAVIAGETIPAVQRDIRAVRIVRVQDVLNDEKEVGQAALL